MPFYFSGKLLAHRPDDGVGVVGLGRGGDDAEAEHLEGVQQHARVVREAEGVRVGVAARGKVLQLRELFGYEDCPSD